MKTIGIIGGLAWPSTLTYYKIINEEIAKRMGDGGRHSAKLLLAQTDFDQVERSQEEGNWLRVGQILSQEGNRLKNAGADFFLMACNTVHAAADYVQQHVDLPLLHIVDPAARAAIAQGARTIGLLGSSYTMSGAFFRDRLREKYGLTTLIPEPEDFENLNQALYQELAKGIFLPRTKKKFQAAAAHLAERGAEAIILGCTEFGLVLQQEDSPVPLIDTTVTHALAAVEKALEDEKRN